MKYLLICSLVLIGCAKSTINDLNGKWQGQISIQGHMLPIKFEFNNGIGTLYNSTERIPLVDIRLENGNFIIPLSIYSNNLEFKVKGHALSGSWVKHKKDKTENIFFNAKQVSEFQTETSQPTPTIVGQWKFSFLDDQGQVEEYGIGNFWIADSMVRGSILTETGDYRFLEGSFNDNQLRLSGFDGQFAYILKGSLVNSQLQLNIMAGQSWNKKIIAVKDSSFQLTPPEKLTKVKGEGIVRFRVQDLNGNEFTEEKFKGKPYLIQIFGTWCPNCLDESVFFSEWYEQSPKDIPILAIGFEKATSQAQALMFIKRMKARLKINYELALGAYDKDQKSALEVLPFLENFVSYPTTIFVNKNGKVEKIHTGFSGPATGIFYEAYKNQFNHYIQELKKNN